MDDKSWFNQSSASTFVGSAQADYITSKKGIFSRSLDSILCEFSRKPDFLKIDVEGAELRVLKGAKSTLGRINFVQVEINDNARCSKFGYEYLEIYTYLESLGFGYKYEILNSDNTITRLKTDQKICSDILFSRIELSNYFIQRAG
jgi:hypothetical protein